MYFMFMVQLRFLVSGTCTALQPPGGWGQLVIHAKLFRTVPAVGIEYIVVAGLGGSAGGEIRSRSLDNIRQVGAGALSLRNVVAYCGIRVRLVTLRDVITHETEHVPAVKPAIHTLPQSHGLTW